MKKPKYVEAKKMLDAETLLFADSDALAGEMLLSAFAHAMKDITPTLEKMEPIKGDPIRVVIMVQARGYEK